jgi:hypothetical protein
MESWRFHRAMHSLILFTVVFPGRELYPQCNNLIIEKKKTEHTTFLEHFSAIELLEIYSASEFLIETLCWTAIAVMGDLLCRSRLRDLFHHV